MRQVLCCAALLGLSLGRLAGIELDAKGGYSLELQTDAVLEASFSLDTRYGAFEEPSVSLELAGDRDGELGFEVSFEVPDSLETALVWFSLPAGLKLSAGQLKAPFGEEINLGKRNRPYPSHPMSSKTIAPGLDRGVSLSGRNFVGGRLDFDAGIFNGLGAEAEPPAANSVLAAGKASWKLLTVGTLDAETGYSAAYGLRYQEVYYQTLAQGLYVRVEAVPVPDHNLTFFAEYLERHTSNSAVNDDSTWTFGFFSMLSYRVDPWEVFAAADLYRADARVYMPEDQWQLSGGVNMQPFKEVRLSLVYDAEYLFNTGAYTHEVRTITYFRF